MSSSSSNLLPGTPRVDTPENTRSMRPLSSKPPRAPEEQLNATWEMWDIIRSICDYHPRLGLGEFSICRQD